MRWQGKPYSKEHPLPVVREKEVHLENVKTFLTTGEQLDDHPAINQSMGQGHTGTAQGEGC